MQDVEEFDMGSNSDEDLFSNALQLPPSQATVPSIAKAESRSADRRPGNGAQQYPGQRQSQPQRPEAALLASTSLSNPSNRDIVMSEASSEDEGDFDDLANDLESSLVGQGPFARASFGAEMNHNVVSSEDEDDAEGDDFVNALSEQSNLKASAP